MSVAVEPPALTGEALETANAIAASFKAATESRSLKNLRCSLLNKEFEEVWFTQLEGAPAMLGKVVKSKARSYLEGKELLSPGACTTMCCYFCPWACGCTNQMPIQGTIGIELSGTSAAALVVAGAPMGAQDLAIAEEIMTSCGFTKTAEGGYKKGGAPDSACIER